MRIILAAIVLIIGANIGISAINSISKFQDAKLQRICESIPEGSGYDETCGQFR
tara:strand:- start:176 stop:337 length:162 start_codon:yes stop_codon:yes gene_type:complete